MMIKQQFSSDNGSAVDPRIMNALVEVGRDHVWAYGDDPITQQAEETIQRLFQMEGSVFFVYNGTGANVTSLTAATRSHESVICTEMAHINEDECGAPEKLGGFKLHGIPAPEGKLTPGMVAPFLKVRGFEHTSQPRTVSITQATEVGTIYTPEEVAELSAFCREWDLLLHMDGARISNAAVRIADRTNVDVVTALRSFTTSAGVDILSFGATKNGLMFGEAVVVFRRELAEQFRYIRKQSTQLHSKMRYVSAQFLTWLEEGIWEENARRANRGADLLSDRIGTLPGVEIAFPVESNGVFVRLPERVIEPLREEFGFYLWDQEEDLVRLMVSYDTNFEFIERFSERLKELL